MLGVNATQRYFGRFILFFLIGQIQALVTGLGCLYYIGMQCVSPGRFLLACCVCSLNFCVMNYSLVYALDNIGMALSVIIMVLQVAGSGGTYPIDVVPQLFQTLYPIMPFHYGMGYDPRDDRRRVRNHLLEVHGHPARHVRTVYGTWPAAVLPGAPPERGHRAQ